MIQPDRLDRFFPITYPNGNTVSRFAKHCPHCKQLVKASAMEGMALLLKDKVFVLADGHCPHCQHSFVVKCVIDEYKQVHAVGLPVFLYRMMLQWGARKQVQTFRQQSDWRMAQQEASEQADSAPAARGTQLADSAIVQKSEEILGNFMGQPIHAWIMSNGQRLVYERAVPPGGSFQLAEQEVLFENRLIYRPA